MKNLILLKQLFILFLLTVLFPLTAEDTLYYEVNVRLLVQDRQSASNILSLWAEKKGGYYTVKTNEQIVFRLPDAAVSELKSYLIGVSEELVEYNQNTYDLREQLSSTRSALQAREEILTKNISYIASSDVEGTLTLEKEIRRLMGEIDMYRGILRKMENDRNYAKVSVILSFQNQTIPDSRPSNFEWINGVDFYDFMQYARMYNKRGFGGPAVILPEGFALIDKSPEFLAISPEGVRIRVRKVDNYPEKSSKFWQKTLFAYLSEQGYIPLKETSELNFGEDPFAVRHWGVPYGNEDYIYISGIRLTADKIELLEIAGPAKYVREYFPD